MIILYFIRQIVTSLNTSTSPLTCADEFLLLLRVALLTLFEQSLVSAHRIITKEPVGDLPKNNPLVLKFYSEMFMNRNFYPPGRLEA